MDSNRFSWIDKELLRLKKEGLYSPPKVIEATKGVYIKISGRKLINFCSNNYLGLADDKRLKLAVKKAIDEFGIGPAAVRTISGTTKLHTDLERKLAQFKKVNKVLTFQSGFAANLATIPAIVGEGDIIFSDELNHASIIDGCRLSKAEITRFSHCDFVDLERKLKRQKNSKRKLIVTDGVFSMDGDIAPLPHFVDLTQKYNCILMVDDAHGEGVLGKNGRGIVEYFNLHGKVDIEVGTMSKAFGVVGGYVAGSAQLIEWLTQRGRQFLFSSAMTIADTAACLEAIKILEKSDSLIKKLWNNTNYFKENMQIMGFDIGKSQTPIVPVLLGDAKKAFEFSKLLFERGVFAKAIGYPTVPPGKARIRVIISAAHSKSDLNKALRAFEEVGKIFKVI